MPVHGSCVCGDWTYQYEGQPLRGGAGICHCTPCHKTAGANGSYNLLIPKGNFKKLSGNDTLYERVGDSGKHVKYKICATCYTIMVADVELMPDVLLVKGGTIDEPEEIARYAPVSEIYRRNAAPWCVPFASAVRKDGAS